MTRKEKKQLLVRAIRAKLSQILFRYDILWFHHRRIVRNKQMLAHVDWRAFMFIDCRVKLLQLPMCFGPHHNFQMEKQQSNLRDLSHFSNHCFTATSLRSQLRNPKKNLFLVLSSTHDTVVKIVSNNPFLNCRIENRGVIMTSGTTLQLSDAQSQYSYSWK